MTAPRMAYKAHSFWWFPAFGPLIVACLFVVFTSEDLGKVFPDLAETEADVRLAKVRALKKPRQRCSCFRSYMKTRIKLLASSTSAKTSTSFIGTNPIFPT